ncbi:DUF4139 domain-containing protein [Salibacter halophilus]|uniref:DUF4139 domain-containing protein n=1 Tax=Salibacter halophilus TaxID=1803916 RepID=A0A6N6M869_9FLAO|nr:DUF4139 domain-containing protein [Salibacter halophilus]KAB1064294.1 DUF4139 domain-containing protein [Salibacter halophilus]
MKIKQLLTLLVIFISLNSFSENDTLTLNDLSIEEVTVFKRGVEIKRVGKVEIPEGRNVLIFPRLESSVESNSIRVKIDNVEILSIQEILNYDISEVKDEIKNIDDTIDGLLKDLKSLQSEESILKTQKQLLYNSTSKKDVDIGNNEIQARLTLLKKELSSINKELFSNGEKQESIAKEIRTLNLKRERITSQIEKNTNAISIEIMSSNKERKNIELKYFSRDAGWNSKYDLKVRDIEQPTILEKWVDIRQNTGRNWENISINISSYHPTTDLKSTSLEKYYIDEMKPDLQSNEPGEIRGKVIDSETLEPVPFANIIIKQKGVQVSGTSSDFDGNFSLRDLKSERYTLEATFVGYKPLRKEIVVVPEEVSNIVIKLDQNLESLKEFEVVDYKVPLIEKDNTSSGNTFTNDRYKPKTRKSSEPQNKKAMTVAGVTINSKKLLNSSNKSFSKLPKKYSIKSSSSKKLNIEKDTVNSDFKLTGIPKNNSNAFVTATIPNWQEYGVPPNSVINIFYQNEFNGVLKLDKSSKTNDTLDLAVGIAKQIILDRDVKIKNDRKGIRQNKRQTTEDITLTVKNTSKSPVIVDLKDQYPLAKNEEIEIELVESGNADVDKDKGILSWEVTLQPNETKEYNFKYTVEYPPNYSY